LNHGTGLGFKLITLALDLGLKLGQRWSLSQCSGFPLWALRSLGTGGVRSFSVVKINCHGVVVSVLEGLQTVEFCRHSLAK
jgi:hypothetical protein